MTDLRWGIMATGGITRPVLEDIALLPGHVAHAVSSRTPDRAREFAAEKGIPVAHDSHEALLADPDVDAVYLATPHGQHHRWAVAALEAGKPILCEKAITCSLPAAQDLFRRAQDAQVFLMEAVWTRFVPAILRLQELLADGAIGEVRSLTSAFGFHTPFDPTSRLYDPALGGGALLDVGIYPVQLAHLLLGVPTRVQVRGTLSPSGSDLEVGLQLEHAGGATAQLACAVDQEMASTATVVGTRGRIDVVPPAHSPDTLVIHRKGHDTTTEHVPREGNGYAGELREVAACLARGAVQSDVMPWQASLEVMGVLDAAMRELGAVTVDVGDEGFAA